MIGQFLTLTGGYWRIVIIEEVLTIDDHHWLVINDGSLMMINWLIGTIDYVVVDGRW